MEIQHSFKDHTGTFFIAGQKENVAEIVYKLQGNKTMIITHTEVQEEMTGKGIGSKLVDEAVNFARQHQYKVKATCHFAKSILDKTDNYKDVYIN